MVLEQRESEGLLDAVHEHEDAKLDRPDEQIKLVSTNCTDELLALEEILMQMPPKAQERAEQMNFLYTPIVTVPDASGFLYMQKNTGQWRRLWCELVKGELSYRVDEGSERASGIIPVCYYAKEEEEPSMIRSELARYGDMYWEYIKSLDHQNLFWICSPRRIYLFRCESAGMRDRFLQKCEKHLSDSHPDFTQLTRKNTAMQQIIPYLREQFLIQMDQYNSRNELIRTRMEEDELPITSKRKEKSGVLSMETPATIGKWRDYYFVLFEGCLYNYKDSKSTNPTGFISLRRASIFLDSEALSQGEFVFHVQTPLRTLVCKAKHAVALSEWALCLENAIRNIVAIHGTREKRLVRKSSLQVLQAIDKLCANVCTLKMMIKSSVGLRAFKQYLESSRSGSTAADVDFYIAVDSFSKLKLTGDGVFEKAKPIWDAFYRSDNKDMHVNLPMEIVRKIEEKLPDTTNQMIFATAADYIKDRLEEAFKGFAATPDFDVVRLKMEKMSASKTREVDPFRDGMQQSFILKEKGKKRSREIIINRRHCVFTIGRDKSNHLVIEDSRVSRSHARVEYSDHHCEYIDLGSSCGSKLNGKAVLRTKLQPGDVIELGQSSLIFQLKKRKKFLWFWN